MPRDKEELMEALARNRKEIGLPGTEGGVSTAENLIPIIGLLKSLNDLGDIKKRAADPEYLHNTAGKALQTNYIHGAPSDTFGKEADAQMMSEGGVVQPDEKHDPAEIPEDIKEYVEKAHKAIRESRPDESWRVKTAAEPDEVAPYKRDEEEPTKVQHFDEGGVVQPFDVDGGDSDTVKMGGQGVVPPPAQPAIATKPAIPDPSVPRGTTPPTDAVPDAATAPAAPALTDQDFMDRANKILGLKPQDQAGFMKLLGDRSQKAQIGAGIAGIGDAIASGGTLGKVNPGALGKSEDLIQGKTREGLEGMQTIRGNQEKAQELADKLETRDPKSPLSQWAQKQYAPLGKKIGLDLSGASAALIGDISGKGIEALNTEYQNQLKMMGLDLQKKQVEATIGNQKAERAIAKQGHQLEATKALADQGFLKKGANLLTPSGRTATSTLENIAKGQEPEGPFGAETVRNGKTYEWSAETGKYHLKR
jgi:hypothetical protein